MKKNLTYIAPRTQSQIPFQMFGEWIRNDYTPERSWSVKVLNAKDTSPEQIRLNLDKCLLCRDGVQHSQLLHEDIVNNPTELPGHIKQLKYVDQEDAMEWEILNAEAGNRPVNWGITHGKNTEGGFTQQQIDAMWQ